MSWQEKKLDSRRVFVNTLNELAEKDDKIIVLIPDVGFNYLSEPDNKFKVINTGVTEQSTVMIAVGLALEGFKPYVYSMINFVVFRPFEMVRNGVALHKANVKLVGVKGSEAYKFLGFSHNMVFESEDQYHLKPYMYCFNPISNDDVHRCIINTYNRPEACYIRL